MKNRKIIDSDPPTVSPVEISRQTVRKLLREAVNIENSVDFPTLFYKKL